MVISDSGLLTEEYHATTSSLRAKYYPMEVCYAKQSSRGVLVVVILAVVLVLVPVVLVHHVVFAREPDAGAVWCTLLHKWSTFVFWEINLGSSVCEWWHAMGCNVIINEKTPGNTVHCNIR